MLRHLALLPLLATLLAAEPATVQLLDVQGLSTEEKVAAYALAGLRNRGGPQILLRGGRDIRWSSLMLDPEKPGHGANWDAATRDGLRQRFGDRACTEDLWVEHFTQAGRFRFVPTTLPDLLKSSPQVKGCILYADLKGDCCPAATLAGLEDAIPVTRTVRDRLIAQGVTLPVVVDYTAIRSGFTAGSDARLEGHRWAIAKLLPRCADTGTVSRDRTYNQDAHDTVVDIDQAVRERWFVYDLDHRAASNQDGKVDRDPPDKELIDTILSHAKPFSPVFGWGRPDENGFTRAVGRNRQVVVCSGVLNNSFFAALPATRKVWKQKPSRPAADDRPEESIHLALMVNEGDSVKEAISLQGMGGWTQPERGTIPINWGMDPLLCTTHPGLMDFYYDGMTDQDHFFAATSGWGYMHPGHFPAASLMDYAAQVRMGGALADLHTVDIWWAGKMDLATFLRAAGMSAMTQWWGDQSVRFLEGGIPVVRSNHFYTMKEGPERFAQMLIEDMRTVKPPWFIVVYGAADHATPHKFATLMKHLPRERFTAETLDVFMANVRRCQPLLGNRVWKPGPNAPKGVAP